jgi:hypothetical protein
VGSSTRAWAGVCLGIFRRERLCACDPRWRVQDYSRRVDTWFRDAKLGDR